MKNNKMYKFLMDAKNKKYAVPSVNFIDLEMIKAFFNVAKETKKPIIISFAEKHLEYLDFDEALNLYKFYYDKYKINNVVLHLDHGENIDFIKKAIDFGFDSVMIDASSKKFDENVKITKEIVEYAHKKGVFVEAEIGHVGNGEIIGLSCSEMENDDSVYTTVEEAVEFVRLTNVDSLAISIGTAHGKYKGEPKINFERLKEIREKLDIPLVLHGGSSSGDENLNRCAKEGISKINVYTDFLIESQKANSNLLNYPKNKMNMRKAIEEKLKKVLDIFETKEYYE